MSKFLDRQYGHKPWMPPKQKLPPRRWAQPEEVIGTVPDYEEAKYDRLRARVEEMLKATIVEKYKARLKRRIKKAKLKR